MNTAFPTRTALTVFTALTIAATSAFAKTPTRLPVQGLAILMKGKTPVVVPGNGRYVATVALYDKWTGRYVVTPEDAAYSASHIVLDHLKLKPADLSPRSRIAPCPLHRRPGTGTGAGKPDARVDCP